MDEFGGGGIGEGFEGRAVSSRSYVFEMFRKKWNSFCRHNEFRWRGLNIIFLN